MIRPGGSGLDGRHNAMVSGPSGEDWDGQVYYAWCRDCDWSFHDITYYQATDAAVVHETETQTGLRS